jgi:MerR family copper efflux transcriptional regulator
MTMKTLRSGELARLAHVNVETLRFYERQGLLAMPARRASGYREYPVEAVKRVVFIKRAQLLGFTLRETKELMALWETTGVSCGDMAVIARRKIEEIEAKIRDLRSMRKALTKLIKHCPGPASNPVCPIVESLMSSPEQPRQARRINVKNASKIDTRGGRR